MSNSRTSSVTVAVTPPSSSWDEYRLLVDSIVEYAIFLLDSQGCVVTWNPGAERIEGYAANEILGEHFSKFYSAEDLAIDKPRRELEIAMTEGRFEDEGWRIRKDGSRFWASVVITALRDHTGKLRGFGKVTRDLTAQRCSEEKLRHAEQRFHHLVDAVIDYAIFMLDPEGHVATWNPGARRVTGYSSAEIIGKHFSSFFPAKDRAAGEPERILETVRRDGRCEIEGWRVRNDGTHFWANIVMTALRDDDGTLIGFANVTRDLTESRSSREELQRSEERFRLLVENVNDYAIYLLDASGRVTSWNNAAERMKGYRATEIVGKHFAVFFPQEDVAANKPSTALATAERQGRFEDEGWRVRKDGTRFWANAILTPLRAPHGALLGFAKITRDLTARREAEETERRLFQETTARAIAESAELRLRASEERYRLAAAANARLYEAAQTAATAAEEASRAKDEFLATVSHELRTPLNAILGWATLLKDRVTEPSIAKPVEVIHRNAQLQVKIIDDILDVSRVITGKMAIDARATDLVAIARDALEVVRPSAFGKQIELELTSTKDCYLLVGDPERLQQVVWNLLSNAVKFTDAGGTIRVSVDQVGSTLTLSVTDTGRGIDPDFLPYVFDRFKQADSSITRRVGGLGLGLALVRHIIDLHGGQVTAKSEGLGKGSTFTISLPVRAVIPPALERTPPPRTKTPSSPKAEPANLKDVKVLVVDDEADARELIAALLVEAGALVKTAASAPDGLELFERFSPDVLVSDIGMPDEDGFSLIRRIRALPSIAGDDVRSLALTAFTREKDCKRAVQAGYTTHLGKPVDPHALISVIAKLAARPRH